MKINKEELEGLLDGSKVVLSKDELGKFSIHDQVPKAAVFPDTYEEVSRVVKYCSKNKLSIVPYGSGTKVSLWNSPDSYDVALGLEKLSKIVCHNEVDFIVTVQAGAKLEDVQKQLLEKDQFIALDPPLTEQGATIGGIISSNDSGPLRLRYNTCREQILEVKVVRADGEIVRGGAKVVKNVAGYDLPKLFVGSLGTLGVIVEATLRVYPVAEKSVSFIFEMGSTEEMRRLTERILKADISPSAFEVVSSGLLRPGSPSAKAIPSKPPYAAVLKIENVSKAVDEQIAGIVQILRNEHMLGILLKNDKNIWQHIRNFPFLDPSVGALCRINVLITDISKVFKYIEELSQSFNLDFFVSAKAGVGSMQVLIKGESRSLKMCVELLRSYAATLRGNVIVQRLPDEFNKIDKWSDLLSSYSLMKMLKVNFDPGNILSPGRFV